MSPVRNRPLPRLAKAGTAVVALSLAALSACSSVGADSGGSSAEKGPDAFGSTANASDVKDGGTLNMALSAEPDMLDPTLSRSLYSRYVFSTMCEKLYDVNQDAEIVPQLATDLPKTSDGGKTVTIPLRTDAVFSDGTKMDSAAVKTTLQRDLTNPQSGRVSELGPVSSIDTPDASTVVVHFKQPFTPFTAALADRAGMIMSPTALKKYGDNFASHPSCVGPFKFSKRVPQNSIEVVRDPNYYDADKVHLDKIVWRILSDSGIRAANLRSGDVEVADTISAQDVGELSKDSSLSILQSQSLGYQGVTFNVGNVDGVGTDPKPIDRPDAKDARVRQAFEYAIDRNGPGQGGLQRPVRRGLLADLAGLAVLLRRRPELPPARPGEVQAAAQGGRRLHAVQDHDAGVQHPRQPAARPGAAVDGQGRRLRPEDPARGVLLAARPAGPRRLRPAAARLERPRDPDANITPFVGTGGSLNVAGYSTPTSTRCSTRPARPGTPPPGRTSTDRSTR